MPRGTGRSGANQGRGDPNRTRRGSSQGRGGANLGRGGANQARGGTNQARGSFISGRGGVNQARGSGRHSNDGACHTSVTVNPDVEKVIDEQFFKSNGNIIVPLTNEKQEDKATVKEQKIDYDPDHLYRSKIPVKDPEIGYGVRYNPNDPNATIPVTKVFVTQFTNIRRETLKKIFSQYGPVKDVTIKHGPSYSYAFVTFVHHKSALTALRSTTKLNNRTLLVQEASAKNQPNPAFIDKLAAISAPDKCYIEKLNDDCLRNIFSYLNLVTRTKVEVVCKCWHQLSRNMWLVVRSLNFCEPPFSTFLAEGTELYDYTAKQLTSYTGHNLSSLTIKRFLAPDTLRVVRDNCTALERLCLLRFVIHDSKVVIPSLKTLKHLSLEECSINDKLLQKLFSVAKCLDSIAVAHYPAGPISFVEHLHHITSLSINQCHLRASHITKFLANNGAKLKCLRLIRPTLDEELYDGAVDLLVKHVPKLENLSLDRFSSATASLNLNSLYKLSHLTTLSLSYNTGVNSDILAKVIRNCKELQNIVLDGIRQVSAEVFPSLGKLPQLKSLSLCNVPFNQGLTNEAIIDLVNNLVNPAGLRSLTVRNSELSDEALYAVLTLCPGLEVLQLAGCHRITEATLMTAEEAVSARTQAPLTLTLGIHLTALTTAVEEAQAEGRKFHPRLRFETSIDDIFGFHKHSSDFFDLDDDDDDADSDYMGDLDYDSDDNLMMFMGGIDLNFDDGLVDLDDYLGVRMGDVYLGGPPSDISDDEFYPAF